MAKITLNNIASIYDLTTLNEDFSNIEFEFQDKVLYRDNPTGEPNQMEQELDMNSNRLINLPEPLTNSEAARLVDVQNSLAGGSANLITYEDENVKTALNKRPIYVRSVAEDFSGLLGVDGQAYHVTGWQAGTEIGGGNFVFRASKAKSAHNGITVFSPTVPPVSAQAGATLHERSKNYRDGVGETDPTGSGAFVREYGQAVTISPTIDAFWSGAEGLPTAANDSTSALTDCITLIGTTGGGELFLSSGAEFYTTSTLNLVSNIKVFGGGAIVTGGARFHHAIRMGAITDVVIDGIKINALLGEDGFDYAIATAGASNVTVQNCLIDNIGKFTTTDGEYGQGMRFEGTDFTGAAGTRGKNIRVLNNTITNIKGAGLNKGDFIYARSTDGILIEGNYCDSCQRMGIALTSFVENFKIIGNTLLNPGAAGIDFETNDNVNDLKNGVALYNYIENYGSKRPDSIGVQFYAVDFHDGCLQIEFAYNVCVSGTNGKSHVYAINGASEFNIHDNFFIGDTTSHGITLSAGGSAQHVSITGNRFNGDCTGSLVFSGGTSTGIVIKDNEHKGTVSADIFQFFNAKDLVISGNRVGSAPRFLYTNNSGGSGNPLVYCIVENNYFEGFVGEGVRFYFSGGTFAESMTVKGNTLKGSSAITGINFALQTGSYINRLSFDANTISEVTNNVLANTIPTSARHPYVFSTSDVGAPFTGQVVFSFDDNKLMQYDGAAWV